MVDMTTDTKKIDRKTKIFFLRGTSSIKRIKKIKGTNKSIILTP